MGEYINWQNQVRYCDEKVKEITKDPQKTDDGIIMSSWPLQLEYLIYKLVFDASCV